MPDSRLRMKKLSKSGRLKRLARIGIIVAVIADRMTTEVTRGDEISMIPTRGDNGIEPEVNIE